MLPYGMHVWEHEDVYTCVEVELGVQNFHFLRATGYGWL